MSRNIITSFGFHWTVRVELPLFGVFGLQVVRKLLYHSKIQILTQVPCVAELFQTSWFIFFLPQKEKKCFFENDIVYLGHITLTNYSFKIPIQNIFMVKRITIIVWVIRGENGRKFFSRWFIAGVCGSARDLTKVYFFDWLMVNFLERMNKLGFFDC